MNKLTRVIMVIVVMVGLGSWLLFSGDDKSEIIKHTPAEHSSGVVKIIAFGDSLTAGYGVLQSEAYPALLEEALQSRGYDVVVINSGVSGETTRGNLERAEFIRSQNPDIVLLGIGGNDALRQQSLVEAEENIRLTIDILQGGAEPPIVVLLQMQSPLNAGFEYKRTFDGMYKKIATDKKVLLVPFITAELFLDSNNKLSDGIHYNKIGYSKVVETHLLPALEAVLTE